MNRKNSKIKVPIIGNQLFLNFHDSHVSFNKEAFESAIRSHGILFEHWRAIPDPSGMSSRGDTHSGLNNILKTNIAGFLYKKIGCFRGLFLVNQNVENQMALGAIDFSTAIITIPNTYEDSAECVFVSPFDRLYLKNVETYVVHSQFVEANRRGVDRLQFPAVKVEHLIDAKGVEYIENEHFKLNDQGHIEWISNHRPGFDTEKNRGMVYAVRFRYIAFFVIWKLLHEIRVANITNPATFDRTTERMPFQAQVVRENVFYGTQINFNANQSPEHLHRGVNMPGSETIVGNFDTISVGGILSKPDT